MNILISLPSQREFKNILATPFFDLIKNDGHKYLIITHSEQLKNIIEPKAHNIKCVVYKTPTKFQKLIYWFFLDRVYETASLRSGASKDQSMFYDRLKKFNKIKYILGLISYCAYKIIGNSLFERFEYLIYNNNFYKGLDVDKILITNYHSLHEKMIFYSLRNRPLYFFTDGWDAFTKQTFYSQLPNVFLLWNDCMKTMLVKNCSINFKECKVEVVGNPFWDTLPKNVSKNKNVLFFSNNSWVYNEEEILQEIYGNVSSSVRFSIRLPPTAEYESKRSSYLTSFPDFKINTMDINFWLKYDLSKNHLFDYAYSTDLTANSIFIFTGPSTAMLDVMEMNSYVVMVCLEYMHTDKSLWDYRLTCDREVLSEVYNYDKFYRFNSVEDLLSFINNFDEYIANETNSESNYSSQLYDKIEETY